MVLAELTMHVSSSYSLNRVGSSGFITANSAAKSSC
jgi:hypothetical protein